MWWRIGKRQPARRSTPGCGWSRCEPGSCSRPEVELCGCCARCSPRVSAVVLASGEQWMSWIGIDDLVDVYYRAVLDPQLSGPINGVAPDPVRNREYTATLGAGHAPPGGGTGPQGGSEIAPRGPGGRGTGRGQPAGRARAPARGRPSLPVSGPRAGPPTRARSVPGRMRVGLPGPRTDPARPEPARTEPARQPGPAGGEIGVGPIRAGGSGSEPGPAASTDAPRPSTGHRSRQPMPKGHDSRQPMIAAGSGGDASEPGAGSCRRP